MTHEQARELALAALDFDLSEDEWRRLDEHLAGCSSCSSFAAAARRDQARIASMPQHSPPPRVHDALRKAEAQRRDRARPLLVLAAAGMAGALAFATLGGGGQRQPVPSVASTAEASLALVSPSPASPSSGATVAPTPSETASAVESAAPTPRPTLTWTRVADQRTFHDPYGDLEAVYATGDRVVAVGDACGSALPECHMAIWTSADADTWERVPDGRAFDAGAYTPSRQGELTDVIATDDGFVAVGRSREDATRRAAVFWSEDGQRWIRSRDDASFALGTMEAIAATPRGFVAVGNHVDGEVGRASAWSSPDGLAWVRTTGGGSAFDVGGMGTFSDGRGHGGMIDVVWTGTRVVAIGSTCEAVGGRCRGVVWTSKDGLSWSREDAELAGTPYSLLAAGGRLVAVGDDGHGSPISWTSDDDGTTWRAGRRVQGVVGNFDAVIETPAGLIASIATPDLTSALAVSGNGRSWEIVADPDTLGRGVINGLTWDPVRQQAIGVGWDGQTPAAVIWVGR
jgi:hypothetical protein